MVNTIHRLPGPRKLWLGLLVAAVALPLAWQAIAHYREKSRWAYLNLVLGSTKVEGVLESGFHFQEYNGPDPFRWTNGTAKLIVPVSARRPPQRLRVSIETYRPKVMSIPFQVLVDNIPVFDGKIALGKWEKTFDLASHPFSQQVLVELRSGQFIPKGLMDRGKNTDTRRLGVQVKAIVLERDENG
jgi:hypothetical protein